MEMEVTSSEMIASVEHLTNGAVKTIPQPTKQTDTSRSISTDEEIAGKLKRCSSAPMINQLVPQTRVSAPPTPTPPRCDPPPENLEHRARRFSATFGPTSPMAPGGSSGRSCSRMRVRQLKEEEGMDVVNREAAHEREVQSSLQMARSLSQSCEDLAIDVEIGRKKETKAVRCDEPSLLLSISAVVPSSPSHGPGSASPTRPGRQCFSPSLQQCVRNSPFSPSPSKRTSAIMARRSLSPITSCFSSSNKLPMKRKYEESEDFITPNKRMSVGGAEVQSITERSQSSNVVVLPSSFSSFKQFSPSPSFSNTPSISGSSSPNSFFSRRSCSPFSSQSIKNNPFSVTSTSLNAQIAKDQPPYSFPEEKKPGGMSPHNHFRPVSPACSPPSALDLLHRQGKLTQHRQQRTSLDSNKSYQDMEDEQSVEM